ncbi:MAG: histone H1 [Chloroflexota bacterium]
MKRSPMPRDPNQRAKAVVDFATGQRAPTPERVKDPAAIARGHLGGIKGGMARAAKMTAAERSESARRAANARWERERQSA